jgi:hypothetical protein
VLRALAKADGDARPTRIVLSNFATDRYRAEAARMGADYFFDKNGEILDLLKTLTAIADATAVQSDSPSSPCCAGSPTRPSFGNIRVPLQARVRTP